MEKNALSRVLTRVAQVGRSAPVLLGRLAVLRSIGKLPELRKGSPAIDRIFVSLPYHRVGDFVLSLTLLERIHARWPAARIHVAVGRSLAAFLEEVPYVERVIPIAASRRRKFTPAVLEELRTGISLFENQLRHISYDLAISPRWDSSDSFLGGHLAYLTGAPIRCGYSGRVDGGSTAFDRVFTHVAVGGQGEHESQRYTQLLARCGLEQASDVPQDIARDMIATMQHIATRRIAKGSAYGKPFPEPYLVIAPGATRSLREWPITNFAEIARHQWSTQGLRTIVLGSPSEQQLCERLVAAIGEEAISLAGKTSALEALDIIAGASMFFGNDSGPGHIAGALGIDTVIISPFPQSNTHAHALSPARFRPVGPCVRVLQPVHTLTPCVDCCDEAEAHCILQITPHDVLHAIHPSLAA